MSLARELNSALPENHVFLPPESKGRIFEKDYTIREVKCQCGTVLCALVIAEEHEADLVWPFDVMCSPTHTLVAKGTSGAAKLLCHGRAATEYEAKKYLKQYLP